MMKSLPILLVLLAAGAANVRALDPKVLILGVDGTMKSALAVAETPHLDALMAGGCYTTREVSDPVTHSAAAWSSIFTGVWGDKHGVTDPGNSFEGNHLDEYPSFYARIEAADSTLNTLAYARWGPIVEAVPDADIKLVFGSDAAMTEATCSALTDGDPDVFWMLLLDVDTAGHVHGWGPDVPGYVQAVEVADGRVGEIIDALTNRTTYAEEDWLVIVQTDHGEHDHPDLERSQIVWSIVWGPSAARGAMWPSPNTVDVCATVLTHMGIPLDPAWNLDGRAKGLPRPPAGYGANLIFNGDAEFSSGVASHSTNRCISWWFDVAGTTLGIYGSNPDFPAEAAPGPPDRGSNFFLGGMTGGSITQRIELTHLAGDIDDPGVAYALSGWFGGEDAEPDEAWLTASFLDASSAALGATSIGHVTPAERGNVTGLLERSAEGNLPVGTRFVEFALTHGNAAGKNDGSADNLSFVLTPHPDSAPVIVGHGATTNGWAVELMTRTDRVYLLERSLDLEGWNGAAAAAAGSGGTLRIHDTNGPADRAFFRVDQRRP